MFSIWFTGFAAFVVYRVFNAGMKSKSLFYRVSPYYGDNGKIVFHENAAWNYAFSTFLIAITWMAVLPVISIFKLGQRFNKEK